MKRVVGLVVVAAITILATIAHWDARREVLWAWRGYADSGEALGVRVGEPFPTAEGRLLRFSGVSRNGHKQGGICIMREFEGDVTLHLFWDRSWRYGVICVAERDGRVAEVIWDYGFLFTTFP